MKKRLMCFIICFVMVLPLILASCGDELTPEEIATKNFQDADTALTLTLWIPTESDTEDEDFNERLLAVEKKINDYLRSRNKSTEIDIIAIEDALYEEKLAQRFAEIKEAEKTNGTAYQTSDNYVNKAKKNPVTGLFELAYPAVLDTQLDLFLVRGYDNYLTYINNKDAYKLNEFFIEGKVYNGIFKLIRSEFMDATKVNGGYYAIPNNHAYFDKAQYIIVNKSLFDTHSGMNWDDVTDIYSLQAYIEQIGALGDSKLVPFVGTSDNIPGVVYLDKDNLIASSFAESYIDKETGNRVFEPDFLYELEEYESFMSFYKALQGKSLVEATLPEGKVPAVQVLDGNPIEIANTYGEEYYVMQTSELYAGVEDVFASMFAVSEHSCNYDRAMQILYLLQDNAEIRTALQYGIEDVDYTIELNDDNQKEIKVNERTSYKMNILYTGNGYRTYPADGSTMDDWKEVIDTNLSVTLDPFFMLRAYIDCNLLSDEQAQQLTSLLSAVSANNKSFKETIDSFTAEEFEAFVSAVGKSISSIEKSLSRSQDQLLSAQENLADAQSRLESAESDEEKAEIQEEIEGYQTRITRYVTDIANYQSQLDIKKNHPELDNAMEDKNQEDLLDLYKDIYSVAK